MAIFSRILDAASFGQPRTCTNIFRIIQNLLDFSWASLWGVKMAFPFLVNAASWPGRRGVLAWSTRHPGLVDAASWPGRHGVLARTLRPLFDYVIHHMTSAFSQQWRNFCGIKSNKFTKSLEIFSEPPDRKANAPPIFAVFWAIYSILPGPLCSYPTALCPISQVLECWMTCRLDKGAARTNLAVL
jgi:hypothetical protein